MYKCNAHVITSFSNIVLQEKYETIENRDADENTNLFNEDIDQNIPNDSSFAYAGYTPIM